MPTSDAGAAAGAPDALSLRCVPSQASAQRARILVVEDNPLNQRAAVMMLGKLGCRADVAANGREALEMLAMLPFDLILMDSEMPVMDGLSATRRIRALPDGCKDIPILAITAHNGKEALRACLAAGMNDHLLKPLTMAALRAALARWLFRKETERAAS